MGRQGLLEVKGMEEERVCMSLFPIPQLPLLKEKTC